MTWILFTCVSAEAWSVRSKYNSVCGKNMTVRQEIDLFLGEVDAVFLLFYKAPL